MKWTVAFGRMDQRSGDTSHQERTVEAETARGALDAIEPILTAEGFMVYAVVADDL